MIFCQDENQQNKKVKNFEQCFSIKELVPVSNFSKINIQFNRSEKAVNVSQLSYIKTALKRFGYDEFNTKT